LAVAIFLRSKAPPEAARLLPESDGIIYVNLKPVRAFFHKDLKPPQRVPEYQQFIDATGSTGSGPGRGGHRAAPHDGPQRTQRPVAYSMVLVGKNYRPALNAWLDAHAAAASPTPGTRLLIPSEGRTVRVAQIGYDMVAVSNTPTPEQIHSMLDRHSTAAWPFAGSTLLRQHYHEVPLLSLAWGVGQIGLPFADERGGAINILGFSLPLEADSTIIASVTPALSLGGSLNVKVVEIAPSSDKAASQCRRTQYAVDHGPRHYRSLADNAANNGLKQLLKTAEVTQERDRVVVTATLDRELVSATAASPETRPDSSSGPGASK
jgi:hypothetical protein